MLFWNHRKQEREALAAEQARQATAAEQLRLGRILYQALEPIAKQNTQVCGGTISAGYIDKNAGKYSVLIMYQSGSHRECLLQFSIDLARNRLTTGWKYRVGPEFTVDQFDQFLGTASSMVRDFK
jgi:hypothetical protein